MNGAATLDGDWKVVEEAAERAAFPVGEVAKQTIFAAMQKMYV